MERDYFLDAQQALEMGLVDKVLTSRDEQDGVMAPLRKAKDDKGDGGNDGKGGGEGGAAEGQAGDPLSPAINPSPS